MGSKRKRNFSSIESVDGSKKQIKDQMKQFLEQIGEKITEINKDLLTVADVEYKKSNLGVPELVLSWRSKKPAFISRPSYQEKDDCWAHAFANGLSAVMIQLGITENLPTAQKLVNQIDKKLLTDNMGIVKCSYAAPSLLQNYGFRLIVHHRPKLHLIKENEDFEKFLERRVAINQVAVCFHYLPGYANFNHGNGAVFCPTPFALNVMRCGYEALDGHCASITGRGVVWRDGKPIEFWEIKENQGKKFGDQGFTRIERHKCIITQAYEFKYAGGS